MSGENLNKQTNVYKQKPQQQWVNSIFSAVKSAGLSPQSECEIKHLMWRAAYVGNRWSYSTRRLRPSPEAAGGPPAAESVDYSELPMAYQGEYLYGNSVLTVTGVSVPWLGVGGSLAKWSDESSRPP